MRAKEDPLGSGQSYPDRVHYANGILLDTLDFNAEQAYHRGRLARTLAYLHGSGTAAGLQVVWERPLAPDVNPRFPEGREERLMVEPGIAIDRLGRIIEVPRAACISLDRWYRRYQTEHPGELIDGFRGPPTNGILVDVFVRFVECERGKTPAFAQGPFDSLDAAQPSRVRDGYDLELLIRQEEIPAQKLPENPWPEEIATGATLNDRRNALHRAIFNAWREGTQWSDQDGLVPLREHALNQDTTSVFLARLTMPATESENQGEPPARTTGAEVDLDNDSRSFVYPSGSLARWQEIST